MRGIEKASVFLIVLSPHSIESENVERELGLAHVTRKRILPVMLHRVTVPQSSQYALGSLEVLDISADDIETGIQRILEATRSPDGKTGVVYLDAQWRDKLPAYLILGSWGVLFVLALLEKRLKTEWAEPIVFLILGAVLIAMWASGALRRIYVDSRLKKSGIVLATDLKGFTKDGHRIASEWRNPETGTRYEFYSKRTSFDRLKLLDKTIPVIVDPRDFRTYRMDLPPLPKEASGSLALSEPSQAENNVRRPSPPGEDLVGDIFLSHAETDGEAVGPLLHKLETAGYTVWRSKTANGKEFPYEEQVIEGISGARLFLLILSPDSIVESSRVRRELDLAIAKRKRIVTAVLRRTIVPQDVEYALATAYHVDLSKDFETGVARLLETIGAEAPKVTVAPESAAASWAAWLRPKLRGAWTFIGWIPIFMPLILVCLVLEFMSRALPVRLRPSRLQAKLTGWAGSWDELGGALRRRNALEGGDLDKDKGTLLTTEYETFEVNSEDRQAVQILSLWRDPVSQERYRFRSNWLACEPEYIKTKIIPVYVDPKNLRTYSMDLSFLPADQRRKVPRRAPFTRRLRNRLLRAGNPAGGDQSSAAPLQREQEEIDSSTIFVSHSDENVDKARLLMERLEGAGYEMVNELSLARTILIIVPSAAASDLASQVLELRDAYTLNKRILPVTFGDYEIPPSMQLSLAGVQCVDLSRDFESGIRVLLNALPSSKSGQAPASDRPREISPSISGSRVRRLVSSAMMGASSWALGFTLSILSLDRGSAMYSLISSAPPVVLAYGSGIGAIFYQRRINTRRLFWAAFLSLLLLPIAVGLFMPGNTVSGRDTLALMVTVALGTAAFIGAKMAYGAIFNHRLKTRGKLILTEYKGSGMSQWRDPVTDQVHTFVRSYNGILSKPIRSAKVAVFMDPANPSDYYMDLSYLPQPKE